MCHVISLQTSSYRKCVMQSYYRQRFKGDIPCNNICRHLLTEYVSCYDIADSFVQEMSHVISLQTKRLEKMSPEILQTAHDRKCLMQSHCRYLLAGNVSCILITDISSQEISHEISLQALSREKCLM